jgi:hypothetical protein
MKLSIICLLLFFITSEKVSAQNYATIEVDDTYNHIKPGADKSIQYTIKAGKGVEVDATKMDFSILKKYLDGKDPDKIFVICENGTYVTAFSPNQKVTLDKSTLTPYNGNNKFLGFSKGDTPIISIGNLKLQNKQAKMAQVWATTLVVE